MITATMPLLGIIEAGPTAEPEVAPLSGLFLAQLAGALTVAEPAPEEALPAEEGLPAAVPDSDAADPEPLLVLLAPPPAETPVITPLTDPPPPDAAVKDAKAPPEPPEPASSLRQAIKPAPLEPQVVHREAHAALVETQPARDPATATRMAPEDAVLLEAPDEIELPVHIGRNETVRVAIDDDLEVEVVTRAREVEVTVAGSRRAVAALEDIGTELRQELDRSGYDLEQFHTRQDRQGRREREPESSPNRTTRRTTAATTARRLVRGSVVDRVA